MPYSARFMVGKVKKKGNLEFGNFFSSSLYHLWNLTSRFTRENEAEIIFVPMYDIYYPALTGYPFKMVMGYPYKMVIVKNISIPSTNELEEMGINHDDMQKYTDATIGTWHTKYIAGRPIEVPTIPGLGEGSLYLVVVEGQNDNQGQNEKYIMATWNKRSRDNLLKAYNDMKEDPSPTDLEQLGVTPSRSQEGEEVARHEQRLITEEEADALKAQGVETKPTMASMGGRSKSRKAKKRKSRKNNKSRTRTRKNRGFKKNNKKKNTKKRR